MSDFRVQHFTDPDDMQWVDRGEEPPDAGWAIVEPGDVYFDGVQVGNYAVWRLDQFEDRTPYWAVAYHPLEDSS